HAQLPARRVRYARTPRTYATLGAQPTSLEYSDRPLFERPLNRWQTMPTLIWRNAHNDTEQRFSLTRRITSIGSSNQNDVVVDAPDVEANHALIQFDGQRFILQRLSRNAPLRLNNKKAKRAPLDHHDEITLGEAVLEFHLFDTQHETTPTPAPKETTPPHRNYEALLEFSEQLLIAKDVH